MSTESEHWIGPPLGRPVLSDEELEAIRRRWELKDENAALGAILRRFLAPPPMGHVDLSTWEEWEDDAILHRTLCINSSLELTVEEYELVEKAMP